MDHVLPAADMTGQDRRVVEVVERERTRLRRFIRRRVADFEDADDILQDVFYEFLKATRLTQPIEHASAWLFRVARNRITDLFRKRRAHVSVDAPAGDIEESDLTFEDLLPSGDAGPDALYARAVLLEEIEDALDELPDEQREVFVAHELEGRTFKEIAAETGVNMNTLLARKRYAVLRLRTRLQEIHEDWNSVEGGVR